MKKEGVFLGRKAIWGPETQLENVFVAKLCFLAKLGLFKGLNKRGAKWVP